MDQSSIVRGYVYKITCTLNQKVYIGYTKKSIEWRFVEHLQAAKKQKSHFWNALRLYGKDSFFIEVLETIETDSISSLSPILKEREKWWIQEYRSFDPAIGYNSTLGGDGQLANELTREKLREAWQRRKLRGDRGPNFGKKFSEEYRKKLSNAKKGKKRLNYHLSEEQKQKMTEGRRNRIWTKQDRIKHSECRKGKPGHKYTEEQKRELSRKRQGGGNPAARRICCIETQEIFETISLAAEKYQMTMSNICSCLHGRSKTAGKLHWKYVDREVING